MTDGGITLVGRGWKVSATEKVSLGDYENYSPHTSLEGEIPVDVGELTPERRKELKARLLNLHCLVQETVERACENRLREPGHEDWSVQADGGEDDE